VLLPPGKGIAKELSTSYTRFDHLLQDLSENRFSGYVRVNFWGYEGILVMDMGHMIQATSSEREVHLLGEQAILRIFSRARDKDGSIEVIDLSNEVAIALGFALQAVPFSGQEGLQGNALSDIFNFLEQEGMSGYVDLQFSGQRGIGTVYYLEGTPVEAVIRSSKGKIASGEQVFEKFFEIGKYIRPQVQIFKVTEPHSIDEEKSFIIPWLHQKYLDFWGEFLNYMNGILKDRLKKDRFFQNYIKTCGEIAEDFPFLDPEQGEIRFNGREFISQGVLHHPTFLQAMTLVLKRVIQHFPGRKIRRLDLNQIIGEVNEMARRHEVSPNQLDVEGFIFQIFEGSLT